MNISTSILKSISIPIGYLQEKQQLKMSAIFIFSILFLVIAVITLLSFQIFYIL